MTPWRIGLLGGPRLERGEAIVTRFPTRKTAVLLAYLAYYINRAHSRDALLALLWPDVVPPSARNSLSKALSELRSLFGQTRGSPPVLLADHTHVQLHADHVTTDVAEFVAALEDAERAPCSDTRRAALARAIDLYRGDLLPDLHDEWVLRERGWLAERYFQALAALITEREEAGDLFGAVDLAHRGLALDPLREEITRCLMRVYAATGRPALARRQFDALERVLHAELDATPDPATVALRARIDAGSAWPKPRGRFAASGHSEMQPLSRGASPCHGLPASLTPFFGREADLFQVRRLIREESRRLVTLVGTGGSGKTRLAVEIAAGLHDRFPHGVYFVDLAPLRDSRLVPATIARVLGVKETPGQPLAEAMRRFLAEQDVLLLLDNFEHLLPAASEVACLLQDSPRLHAIVTSRERLHLRGEQEFPVLPLPLADPERLPPLSELHLCPSVALFVHGATLVRPEFGLTEEDAPMVARICARLEGLPLAIELAAARVRLFSLEALLSRLESGLHLLTGGPRDLPARQRGLRDTVAWSYDLLSEEEKRLFQGVSVFAGGFVLEAARAVCEQGAGLTLSVPDGLASLVEKHLLQCGRSADGSARFSMLETIREFAVEHLSRGGEEAAVRRRHADYFTDLATKAASHDSEAAGAQLRRQLEEEEDNLRAILRWSVAQGDARTSLRLSHRLTFFWEGCGRANEGRQHLAAALELPAGAEETEDRAAALFGMARLTHWQGDIEASRPLAEECLVMSRQLGHWRLEMLSLNLLGSIAHMTGDQSQARLRYEAAVDLCRHRSDEYQVVRPSNNLALLALEQGDVATAWNVLSECLEISQRLGNELSVSVLLTNLGIVALHRNDADLARTLLTAGLLKKRELRLIGIHWNVEGLAWVALHQGDAYRAARLLGAVDSLCAQIDAVGRYHGATDLAALRARIGMAIGEEATSTAHAEGAAMTLEQIVAHALEE